MRIEHYLIALLLSVILPTLALPALAQHEYNPEKDIVVVYDFNTYWEDGVTPRDERMRVNLLGGDMIDKSFRSQLSNIYLDGKKVTTSNIGTTLGTNGLWVTLDKPGKHVVVYEVKNMEEFTHPISLPYAPGPLKFDIAPYDVYELWLPKNFKKNVDEEQEDYSHDANFATCNMLYMNDIYSLTYATDLSTSSSAYPILGPNFGSQVTNTPKYYGYASDSNNDWALNECTLSNSDLTIGRLLDKLGFAYISDWYRVNRSYNSGNIVNESCLLTVGGKTQLGLDLSGYELDKTAIWKSLNPDIAMVNNDGVVTGLKEGEAYIMATWNGTNTTYKLKVYPKIADDNVFNPQKDVYMNMSSLERTDFLYKNPYSAGDGLLAIYIDGKRVDAPTHYLKDHGQHILFKFLDEGHADGKSRPVAADYIKTSIPELCMEANANYEVPITFFPDSTYNRVLAWSSSDESVATVSDNGVVISHKEGDAVITAKTTDGSNVKTQCTIHVFNRKWEYAFNPQTDLMARYVCSDTLSDQQLFIDKDINDYAEAVYLDGKKLESPTSLCRLDTVGVHTVVIKAKSGVNNMGDMFYDNKNLRLTELHIPGNITSLSSIPENSLERLYFYGSLAPDKAYDYSSNYYQGLPADIRDRTVHILPSAIGYDSGDWQNYFYIHAFDVVADNVSQGKVTTVRLSQDNIQMKSYEVVQLKASVYPETATDKGVVWTSSDESVATVDEDGYVTAGKDGGDAVITATAHDGGASASCKVHVTKYIPAEKVTLDTTSLTVKPDTWFTLTPTILPADATDQCYWSVSDESVVMNIEGNKFYALKTGVAEVTFTAGNKSATCVVEVSDVPVAKLTMENTSLKMNIGERQQVKVSIDPDNATVKTLEWTSLRPDIATVDKNGYVSALAAGTTVITAKTIDGTSLTANCVVTVTDPTGIDNVTVDAPKENYYNLDGTCAGKNPRGGLFIKHGKKVIIKRK